MSLRNYKEAKEAIERSGGGDFEGPKSESLVAKAESFLNVVFPPSYRSFLLEMGCGDINGFEVYGLIDDNFEKSSIPNGIWMTWNLRSTIGLDHKYLIIGEGGDGTFHAIDTSIRTDSDECPVVRLSLDGKQSQHLENSFGDYFLKEINELI